MARSSSRLLVAGMLSGAMALATTPATAGEKTFSYVGFTAQTWTVPAGVTSATFEVYGARGGQGLVGWPPGYGAKVVATIQVTPGEVLQVNVGGQGANNRGFNCTFCGNGKGGWNGGGDGGACDSEGLQDCSGAGGGGASDVRRNSGGNYSLQERLIVAGGGGGNSKNLGHGAIPPRGRGGNGGGLQGVAGLEGFSGGAAGCTPDGHAVGEGDGTGGGGGGGGGSGAGGTGGAVGSATGANGSNTAGGNGVLGQGGTGGDAFACADLDAGGGGGGGYYGGGGGGGGTRGNGGGGGGGGSSYGPLGAVYEAGVRNGAGSVKVTFTEGTTTTTTTNPGATTTTTAAPATTSTIVSPTTSTVVATTTTTTTIGSTVTSTTLGCPAGVDGALCALDAVAVGTACAPGELAPSVQRFVEARVAQAKKLLGVARDKLADDAGSRAARRKLKAAERKLMKAMAKIEKGAKPKGRKPPAVSADCADALERALSAVLAAIRAAAPA